MNSQALCTVYTFVHCGLGILCLTNKSFCFFSVLTFSDILKLFLFSVSLHLLVNFLFAVVVKTFQLFNCSIAVVVHCRFQLFNRRSVCHSRAFLSGISPLQLSFRFEHIFFCSCCFNFYKFLYLALYIIPSYSSIVFVQKFLHRMLYHNSYVYTTCRYPSIH